MVFSQTVYAQYLIKVLLLNNKINKTFINNAPPSNAMTVINAMKFNDREGGMVTDSQSSTDLRKYDFAEKVVSISSTSQKTIILAGGSGASNFLYEARSRLQEALGEREKYTVKNAADLLAEIQTQMKRSTINAELRSSFGVEFSQALSGQGISDYMQKAMGETFTGQRENQKKYLSGGFLLVGKDERGTYLYVIGIGDNPTWIAQPYGTIGIGGDESDKVLSGFVKSLKREQWHNINPLLGMSVLIRATNASSELNQGVGGVPIVSYFNDSGVTILPEDESRLATEIVRVADAQLIPPEAARTSLEQLLYQKSGFEDVEQETFRKNPQYDKIMRFLRGYK